MKKLVGKVVSDKMQNTAVVTVARWVVHPMYKKRFLRHKKYHAVSLPSAKVGDRVEIAETSPVSKTKKWRVTKVLN